MKNTQKTPKREYSINPAITTESNEKISAMDEYVAVAQHLVTFRRVIHNMKILREDNIIKYK